MPVAGIVDMAASLHGEGLWNVPDGEGFHVDLLAQATHIGIQVRTRTCLFQSSSSVWTQ